MDTYKKTVLITLLLLAGTTSALAQKQPPAAGPTAIRNIILPPMPDNLQVGDGFTAFLVGHAVGTQNYVCKPTAGGFAFCLLYTSPSPRDGLLSRMPSSA